MKKVKIKLNGGIMPQKATHGAAAYDLYVPTDMTLIKGRQIIPLWFSLELPHGYAATIQPRSGFSAKGIEAVCFWTSPEGHTIEVPNARINADVIRGLIDEDYRGVVGVIIQVHDDLIGRTILKKGTRIAQMQIVEVPQVELVEVDKLSETDRGEGGFGSTGAR